MSRSNISPILILAYKRPDTTMHLINALRQVKPKLIYISINIPDKKNILDSEKNNKVLEIIKNINWKCKIKINKKNNLDSYSSYKHAISWFFKIEKEGIILEDDLIPHKSFFIFCSKLLKKYRHNKTITHINGTSFIHPSNKNKKNLFFFSNFFFSWGFATWRRAIIKHDEQMLDWPKLKKSSFLKRVNNSNFFLSYWKKIFNDQYLNKLKAWDYRWVYSNWKNKSLSIVPSVNLIKNIGFNKDATHTINKTWYSNFPIYNLKLSGRYPKIVKTNIDYDDWIVENFLSKQSKFYLFIKKNLSLDNKFFFIFKLLYKFINYNFQRFCRKEFRY
jgi:hypothetical protein